MKIEGNDVIGRSTRLSSRTLILAASSAILVDRYGLNSDGWTILGQANKILTPDQFTEVALAILFFTTIAHLVNWWADWVSYSRWFKTSSTLIATFDEIGKFESSESLLAKIIRNLEQLRDGNYDKVSADSLSDSQMKNLLNILDDNQRMLKQVEPNFRSLTWTSRFVVFVWYLTVPVGLALIACYVTIC